MIVNFTNIEINIQKINYYLNKLNKKYTYN